LFLKKRSSLEEDHANGIRKLTRTTQEVMRRPDHRQGTFGSAYEAMASTHERMAENGIEFSKELHQMHDELMELAGVAERSRKSWKQNGLSAENKVAEMEQTMRKSKAKYDSLAEDYERVKTGESRQSGKMFGLKGHKSAQQHEGELLKKVQAADSTYHGHVQSLQAEKAQLVSTTRPEAIRSLQDSIKEIDAGISLQMQKFGMSCSDDIHYATTAHLFSSFFQRAPVVKQWSECQSHTWSRGSKQLLSTQSATSRFLD
jgi:chromosome segregation ATPase